MRAPAHLFSDRDDLMEKPPMPTTLNCPACHAQMPAPFQTCGACGSALPSSSDTAETTSEQTAAPSTTPATPPVVEEPVVEEPAWFTTDAPQTAADPGRSGTVVQLTSAPTGIRRRWLLPAVGVTAGVLVCAFAVGVTVASSNAAPAPTPTVSAVQEVVGLPGWQDTASWTSQATAGAVAVRADGERVAVVEDHTVTILDFAGDIVAAHTFPEAPRLVTGRVDDAPAVAAVTATALTVWAGDADMVVWGLPADTRVYGGEDVIAKTPDGQVFVATAGGLAPFGSPRPGAAPLVVDEDGAMQWASSRSEVLTASAAGTLISTTPLAPPVAGATVSRWLLGGPIVVVIWTTPDGTQVLATHTLAGGAIVAQLPLGGDPRLVHAPGTDTAMVGPAVINLPTGTLMIPDDTFTASVQLGDAFYGATGATPAVLQDSTLTRLSHPPTINSIGITADGDLIATVRGLVSSYPATRTR